MQGPSATYNIPLVTRLSGLLNPDALAAALNDTIARHEALRTLLVEADGEPCQRIVPAQGAEIVFVRHSLEQPGSEAALAAAAGYTFDLATELPVRAWLFSTGQTEHTLLILLHHIAADGWSIAPLYRDLARAYAGRIEGKAPDWEEPLPVQYADYTLWHRELLGTEDDPHSRLSTQLEYWRTALAGLPDELPLPYDHPRSSTSTGHEDGVEFRIDAATHLILADLARAENITMFMVVHTAVAIVLHLHGAGTDIPVGAPVAGRADELLDGLVGFFVNNLVLRADLGGDPSVRELLARVRAVDLAAFGQQDVPFERVVEALRPSRSVARHPLYQTTITLEPGTDAPLCLAGAQLVGSTAVRSVTTGAKFDLSFDFRMSKTADGSPGELLGWVNYDTGLFDRPIVRRLADCVTAVLGKISADPTLRLSDLAGALPRSVLPLARRAAPEPPATVRATVPGSRAEKAVAAIWAESLGRRDIALHEDFFSLGGSMPTACSVVSRCGEWFGAEIPVQALIEAPTVKEFTQRVHVLIRESTARRFRG